MLADEALDRASPRPAWHHDLDVAAGMHAYREAPRARAYPDAPRVLLRLLGPERELWLSIERGARAIHRRAARRLPWSIARLASSSTATSAPPIRCGCNPAAASGCCNSRSGSWPAQITIESTASVSEPLALRTSRPSSSIRS